MHKCILFNNIHLGFNLWSSINIINVSFNLFEILWNLVIICVFIFNISDEVIIISAHFDRVSIIFLFKSIVADCNAFSIIVSVRFLTIYLVLRENFLISSGNAADSMKTRTDICMINYQYFVNGKNWWFVFWNLHFMSYWTYLFTYKILGKFPCQILSSSNLQCYPRLFRKQYSLCTKIKLYMICY